MSWPGTGSPSPLCQAGMCQVTLWPHQPLALVQPLLLCHLNEMGVAASMPPTGISPPSAPSRGRSWCHGEEPPAPQSCYEPPAPLASLSCLKTPSTPNLAYLINLQKNSSPHSTPTAITVSLNSAEKELKQLCWGKFNLVGFSRPLAVISDSY